MDFRRRQRILAALTANAGRPVPGSRPGTGAFLAGWLTGELSPHALTLTVRDALVHVVCGRRDPDHIAIAGGSAGDQLTSLAALSAELPGAQHAFDVFPSIRSVHVVRAIDRCLHWHWNCWLHGIPTAAEAEPVGAGRA